MLAVLQAQVGPLGHGGEVFVRLLQRPQQLERVQGEVRGAVVEQAQLGENVMLLILVLVLRLLLAVNIAFILLRTLRYALYRILLNISRLAVDFVGGRPIDRLAHDRIAAAFKSNGIGHNIQIT